VIHDLMGISQRLIRLDTPSQNDHGHTVLQRIGNHVDAIHRAGAKRGHKDCRRTVAVMHSLGHETGGVFMFGQMKRDSSLFQRINQSQNFTTRHAKCVAASGLVKALGQKISRAGRGVLHQSCSELLNVTQIAEDAPGRKADHASVTI
jgi:hypothetical protein